MHVHGEGLIPWRADDGPGSALGEQDHLWLKCLGNSLFRQFSVCDPGAQIPKGHRVLEQEEGKSQPQAQREQGGRQPHGTGTCLEEINAA